MACQAGEANWLRVLSCCMLGCEFKPHQRFWTFLQVCGLKMLGCHACCQEVSSCCTRAESTESIAHRQENKQVRDPLYSFKTQGRHHQNSNTVISVVQQKGLISSKDFLKKIPDGFLNRKCHKETCLNRIWLNKTSLRKTFLDETCLA